MDTAFSISLRVVVTLLFLSATGAVLPNGECYVNDMTCEIDDNFIGIADNIMSAEDCKLECENSSAECSVYSYYGPAGVPFRDTCLLFRDCSVLDAVEDCVTEEIECGGAAFCNAPVEGILSDNVVDIVPGVSEADCEAECDVEERCQFFTFYFSNSTVYPSTCFLLSEIKEPIVPCQDETWDELYKDRFSRKIDYQRLFSREYDFPKTFSLTENQFSRKTYFYTIASRRRL